MKKFLLCICILSIVGCLGIPENVEPVNGFELNKYLGKWYEIARLDHPFERGMENISAEYSLLKGGRVQVLNRGITMPEKTWNEAKGKAYFMGNDNVGHLKVSFFGPFYGSYIVFELDKENYQYAFITSSSKGYLWFLSRTPVVDDSLKERFLDTVSELGFKKDEIIWVKHDK